VGPGRELLGEGVYTEAAALKQAPPERSCGATGSNEKYRKVSRFGGLMQVGCENPLEGRGEGLFAKA